jgi:N6-L-threonylcarbamoyladenine synthase
MILALESSCDETAAAVVDATGKPLFNFCISQIALHEVYGGVVPELASRSHFDVLDKLSDELKKSSIDFAQIKSVAATMGPGLVGPLLVGSHYARALACAWQKPFVGVHHLRAHIASALLDSSLGEGSLEEKAKKLFPAWVLLVSGGHCMLLKAQADLSVELIKTTSDDAAGECFDKCAKLVGLPYPGGPAIEREAKKAKSKEDLDLAQQWSALLPRPRSKEGFSFAGLKTAFRLLVEKEPTAKECLPALALALQTVIADSLLSVMSEAYLKEASTHEGIHNLICCGGVSANEHLKSELELWSNNNNWNFYTVPLQYATDNAVMVAVAAWMQSENHSEKSVFPRGHL